MGVTNLMTDLSEIGPLVLERFRAGLEVVVEGALGNFRKVVQIAIDVGNELISDVLLLDVAEDVVVEL